MAEVFVNSLTKSAGIVTTSSNGSIAAETTTITGISTAAVGVGYLVDNQHFRGGAKVSAIGAGQVTVDKTSTNTALAGSQIVNFLGPTVAYTSPAATKSILIGGTFSNLTGSNVNITVEVVTGVTSTTIAHKIPVPNGSSFVISDAGKTVLNGGDVINLYCDSSAAIDGSLSILQGVN